MTKWKIRVAKESTTITYGILEVDLPEELDGHCLSASMRVQEDIEAGKIPANQIVWDHIRPICISSTIRTGGAEPKADEPEGKLKEYQVEVIRTGYGSRILTVKAHNDREAGDLALDEAGDHTYNEHTSEYEVEGISYVRDA